MKKLTFFMLFFIVVAFLGFSQKNQDRELARTQDYIAAATKQGAAKIKALKDYIKKFPNTRQKWTRYAYYSLATENFQSKNFSGAIKYAKETLKIGAPGQGGEEGRLYLVLGNSYGIKGEANFNQSEALKYTDKAIAFASGRDDLKDVLQEARKLKKSLTGPPPVKLTPEQKIKRHYSNEEYAQAISFYKSLGAADKGNLEVHKVYANALFKNKNYNSALTEFQALYEKEKKGGYASRMAEIYSKKAKKDKKSCDSAVRYYLEASLLYQQEQNSSNRKAAFTKARFEIYEKYGFNKKIEAYNKQQQQNVSSAKKNEQEIRRLKLELRKQERHIRRTYERNDIYPPDYELEKKEKLAEKIAALEAGGTVESSDEGAKLEEERKRIEKELKDLMAQAKKRLNL
ncbi:MAG: tetratricopeptide repeat protein [Candidatus Aminicenantes bacterium]|nr:tetratricopeptide repeat protein [Candidatus Aminicenantes bacterium]